MPIALSNSLASAARKLSPNEARRVWSFIERFWENPAHPSLSLERLTRVKTDNLWSGRVSDDLRTILHHESDLWTVLHVDHHDAAYNWARTRRIERHLVTGALQIVPVPGDILSTLPENQPESKPLFAAYDDDYLLSLGIPSIWIPPLRQIESKDVLLNTILDLPEVIAERLLDLAEGSLPMLPPENQTFDETFILNDPRDLERLLNAPLSTWIAFLHPSQAQLAIGTFKGPVKVSGAAGTGKTVVGLHRARHLARQGKRVLLTSFVSTLCHNLEHNLKLLCNADELKQIVVSTVHQQAKDILKQAGESIEVVDNAIVNQWLSDLHDSSCPLSLNALQSEWETIVQARSITTWEEYRSATRSGRELRLNLEGRKQVWMIFQQILQRFQTEHKNDWTGICRRATELLHSGAVQSAYDSVIVDEIQDLRPQEVKLLAAIAGTGSDRLMLIGDVGQQIYSGHFNLKTLGIVVQGRSHILRINYRTTEQICHFANQLLEACPRSLDDEPTGTKEIMTLLQGPEPITRGFPSYEKQMDFLIESVQKLLQSEVRPSEIAIFARTNDALNFVESRLGTAKLPFHRLSRSKPASQEALQIGSMHRAKGLEFKIVFIINVSDRQMPPRSLLQDSCDAGEREAILIRERKLLYVSVTRARDRVFLTWVGQPSPFLSLPGAQTPTKKLITPSHPIKSTR